MARILTTAVLFFSLLLVLACSGQDAEASNKSSSVIIKSSPVILTSLKITENIQTPVSLPSIPKNTIQFTVKSKMTCSELSQILAGLSKNPSTAGQTQLLYIDQLKHSFSTNDGIKIERECYQVEVP